MSVKHTGCLVRALLAISLASAGVRAQEGGTRHPAAVLASLCPTAYVRILRAPASPAEGTCGAVRGDSIQLTRRGVHATLPVVGIDTIWLRQSSTGTGALIGAGLGAASLAALGILFVNAMCESGDGCSDDYPQVVLLGVLVGGGGGVLIGAGFGALVPKWKRRYP